MGLGDDYATAEELAAAFRIDDAEDNTQLALAVSAASTWITQHCDRDFNQADAATARNFHAFSSGMVWVDDISTITGLTVATDDDDDGSYATSWAATDYQLEPLNGMVGGLTGWPYTHIRALNGAIYPTGVDRPAVQVTARWGWPAVPAAVKQASLILAARLYKRRDSADGVLGGFEFGAVRVGTRLDPDVEMLLAPYRKTTALVG